MPITIEEAKRYLGIDYEDDVNDANIEMFIATADSFIKGAIGDDYPKEDNRAKLLALAVVGDLYDNRTMESVKANNTMNRLIDDFKLQLQLEREIAKENQ